MRKQGDNNNNNNHIMQILESEKTAKWQLLQHCEEQAPLVSSLKAEVHLTNFCCLVITSVSILSH